MKTDNTNTPVSVKQSPTSGEQNETIVTDTNNENKEPIKLCVNMDCERYPDDWDFEEDTEDTYQEGQWKKCCLCDGYFDDDGMGDILYVQEEPNNQEAECNLCGKTDDIVQMKGCGQYLCGNACDEDEEEEEEEDEGLKHLIKEDESRLYLFKRLEEEAAEERRKQRVIQRANQAEEDKNAFECDDCNFKGINCYEELGFTKSEFDIYIDLGEPDRCESCFDKWKESSDAYEYLKKIKEEEEESEKETEKETEKESENLVEYHVVTTMYGGFDTGYCYAGEREFEDEEEALKYYNEISLVTLNESKYTGGVQYKRIESGKAHKLENGEYETVYLNENKEETVNEDDEVGEDEVGEDDEKTYTCDLCCRDKSFENYYVFKRGRKQELYSCVKCWENRKTQLVGETWTWTSHTYPGPAFFSVNKEKEKEKEEEDSECDNNIEECKTMCNNSNANKLTCRSHFSNMMFSHICMVIPCIWWIRIDNPETMNAVLYSKLMSMVMIVAIIASYIYHYYNECVLCSAETEYNKFAILCLNIYMYLRNVSIFYIVPGFTILYGLHKSLEYSNSQNKDFYELYHPFCHYIAGLYIYYCVWNLNNAQQKICDATPNNIMYNDISSGVNYPEMRL